MMLHKHARRTEITTCKVFCSRHVCGISQCRCSRILLPSQDPTILVHTCRLLPCFDFFLSAQTRFRLTSEHAIFNLDSLWTLRPGSNFVHSLMQRCLVGAYNGTSSCQQLAGFEQLQWFAQLRVQRCRRDLNLVRSLLPAVCLPFLFLCLGETDLTIII